MSDIEGTPESLPFLEQVAEEINRHDPVRAAVTDELELEPDALVTVRDIEGLTLGELGRLVTEEAGRRRFRLDFGITMLRNDSRPKARSDLELARGKVFTFEPTTSGKRYIGLEHFRSVGAAVSFIGTNSATKAFNCLRPDKPISVAQRQGIEPLQAGRIRRFDQLPDYTFKGPELIGDGRILPLWQMYEVEEFLAYTNRYFEANDYDTNRIRLALYYTMRLTQQVLDGDTIDWANLPDYRSPQPR